MSSQQPRGRQPRSGGGRALMLLGVLLALLSGVLVIFIVSNATTSAGQTEQLVVANQEIQAGTILGVSQIQADFTVRSYPVSLVPSGAYVFTTEDALQVKLSQTVAQVDIYPGDVLLTTDPRYQLVGSSNANSTTSINPAALKDGYVLFPLTYSNPSNGIRNFVSAGDSVDVIVTECGADYTTDSCSTQTTFQSLYVYATFNGSLIVVVDQQDAKYLKVLMQTGNVTLALRKPGDTTQDSSAAVTPADVASYFKFN